MSFALCLTDALYLAFTSGKHLFMLEPASVTTAEALTCISPLGGRISMEWWMWWLQQQCGQQQRGQIFGVVVVVRVVVAVLASVIGRGPEVAEWLFYDLVRVGRQCLQRVILTPFNGSFAPLPPWFCTLGGSLLACAPRCARACENAVAVLPLRRARYISRSRSPLVVHKCSEKRRPTRVYCMCGACPRMLKTIL